MAIDQKSLKAFFHAPFQLLWRRQDYDIWYESSHKLFQVFAIRAQLFKAQLS